MNGDIQAVPAVCKQCVCIQWCGSEVNTINWSNGRFFCLYCAVRACLVMFTSSHRVHWRCPAPGGLTSTVQQQLCSSIKCQFRSCTQKKSLLNLHEQIFTFVAQIKVMFTQDTLFVLNIQNALLYPPWSHAHVCMHTPETHTLHTRSWPRTHPGCELASLHLLA